MELFARGVTLRAAVGIFALTLTAQAATIFNSNHDMNRVFGAGTIAHGEVCLPCHAPHNLPNKTVGKLWNHKMSKNPYTLYGSGSSYITTLDETSRMCLSCHDGSTAVDSYGVHTGTNPIGGTSSTAGFLIGSGGDLTHDHPVGVKYPTTFTSMNDPASWSAGTSYLLNGVATPYVGTVVSAVRLSTIGTDKVVTCASCHTPHDNTNRFLLMKNTKSQLCLTCHMK